MMVYHSRHNVCIKQYSNRTTMRLSVGEDTTHSPLRSINLGVYVQNLQIHN